MTRFRRKRMAKLRTDLPYVASRGLKPLTDGLAASSIDDMMEKTGPNDPDAIGADTNTPNTPWDGGADEGPAVSFGKGQKDD
jgi:hypothetical protein